MNKLSLTLFIIMTLSAPLYNSVQAERSDISHVDRIRAVINGEIITEGDIDLFLPDTKGKDNSAHREAALQQLIHSVMIRQKSKEFGINIPASKLKEEAERLAPNYPDIPIEKLMQWIEDDHLKNIIKVNVIKPRINISPNEIQTYYKRHKDSFSEPAKVLIRAIAIQYFPDMEITSGIKDIRTQLTEAASLASDKQGIETIETLNEKIVNFKGDKNQLIKEIIATITILKESEDPIIRNESIKLYEKYRFFKTEKKAAAIATNVLKQLKSGETFETLVAEYSEGPFRNKGGKWSWFSKGDLRSSLKPVSQAAFTLKSQEISSIIDTNNTKYIIQKIGEQAASIQKPSDPIVQDTIRKRIMKRKQNQEENKFWEEIEESAYIKIFD